MLVEWLIGDIDFAPGFFGWLTMFAVSILVMVVCLCAAVTARRYRRETRWMRDETRTYAADVERARVESASRNTEP